MSSESDYSNNTSDDYEVYKVNVEEIVKVIEIVDSRK